MLAYHFVGDTLRDGQPIPADGEWLVHDGPVGICETGLHASKHVYDALQYAPGATLCHVECEDIVTEHIDKFVCRRRKIIARFDATDTLRAFARHCALSVIHLWEAPQVVRQYLETGDECLRTATWAAARYAAWDAAWDAAWAATGAAARDAAWAATGAAARDAAGAATWAAARDAAGAATWAAARYAARDATWAAAGAATWAAAGAATWDAARYATWAAARDAAGAAQRTKFVEMVAAKFKEMGHEQQ